MKLEYKPIAVQNECWTSKDKDDQEVTVLVKLAAQGKKNVLYKITAESFPTPDYLDAYIKKHNLVVVPQEEFKSTEIDNVLAIIKQSK